MFLAFKELKFSRLRFILVGSIAVLIALLVFILSGLTFGLGNFASATLRNMEGEYMVLDRNSQVSMRRSHLDGDLLEEIGAFEGVDGAEPFGNTMSRAYSQDGTEFFNIAFQGLEPGGFLEPEVIEGRQLDSSNPYEIIADTRLQDGGFEIGDQVRLDGFEEELTIVGFVRNETYGYAPSVFTDLGTWSGYQPAAGGISAIVLQGRHIQPQLLNEAFADTETVAIREVIANIPGFSEQSMTFNMMLGFLLVISAFVLAVFFYVMTLQKTNQFGVLKAMGASNGFLARAVVSQMFLLSLASIIIGLGLTYLMTSMMPASMPFAWDTHVVLTYSGALLAIAVISSLMSVRKITKIDPLLAMGRGE